MKINYEKHHLIQINSCANSINKRLRDFTEGLVNMYNELNDYTYGWLDNKGKMTDDDDKFPCHDYWHMLSYNDFERLKGGICWDFANYQIKRFPANEDHEALNFMLMVYTRKYDDLRTHTITVYPWMLDDALHESKDGLMYRRNPTPTRYYWVESVFHPCRGVFSATNLHDIFRFVIESMVVNNEFSNEPSRPLKYSIYQYNPAPDGVSSKEFLNYIWTKCKVLYDEKQIK